MRFVILSGSINEDEYVFVPDEVESKDREKCTASKSFEGVCLQSKQRTTIIIIISVQSLDLHCLCGLDYRGYED